VAGPVDLFTDSHHSVATATGVGAHAAVVLCCEGLARAYGDRPAVRDLSFQIRAGEVYGLVGPNGAGKTTTIRMVCGILEPDRGSVTVAGGAIGGRAGRRARAALGYVPQELALFPVLTLAENLEFWSRMYGVPRRHRAPCIAEALARVGLADRAGDRADRTSGGMQRRLNFAIALLHEPRLLVLDEPTVGVDPQSRASLLDTIGRLRDEGTAVLYTSHYLDEVERVCDRVGIIDHGVLLVEGTPGEIIRGGGDNDLQDVFLRLTGRELRD
jgi:linearmycin/streptolysin S transport system ATP-binding protein